VDSSGAESLNHSRCWCNWCADTRACKGCGSARGCWAHVAATRRLACQFAGGGKGRPGPRPNPCSASGAAVLALACTHQSVRSVVGRVMMRHTRHTNTHFPELSQVGVSIASRKPTKACARLDLEVCAGWVIPCSPLLDEQQAQLGQQRRQRPRA
jgi:hypothetical protein